MSHVTGLYKRIRNRISREGLMNVLYAVSARIDYPVNGFPRYGVDTFMVAVSRTIKNGARVLDAGAGHCPYKKLFDHTEYESCDFMSVLEETGGNTEIPHTFYCDLEEIPKEADTYDAIICNQVLEHTRHPQKVINKIYRILRPGGELFLTVPQCSGIHMEPHHYFNFTNYGLVLLFEEAGLHVKAIKPLGGVFWLLGKVAQKAYESLLARVRRPLLEIIFFPFHLLFRFLIFILSVLLFHMDKLDKNKEWTLNYGCHCVKPTRE